MNTFTQFKQIVSDIKNEKPTWNDARTAFIFGLLVNILVWAAIIF